MIIVIYQVDYEKALNYQIVDISEIERVRIVQNFKELINPWCEYMAKRHEIKEDLMCQVAIKTFGDNVSPTWIRECVESRFKIKSQMRKRKISLMQKIKNVKNYAKEIGIEIHGTFEDLQESAKYVMEETE